MLLAGLPGFLIWALLICHGYYLYCFLAKIVPVNLYPTPPFSAPILEQDRNEVAHAALCPATFCPQCLCTDHTVQESQQEFDNVANLPADIALNLKGVSAFVPPVSRGLVVKVYDGDTITVVAQLPFWGHLAATPFKFSVRLNGIDTPEIKGKNADEKEIAQKARDALSARIMGKDIFLKNVQTEKYGRLLCDIYLGKENLNQWMIQQRYALSYDGGTKVIPKSWKKYHEQNII
eukprot:SAG31_NODE_20_length_34168_cov_33.651296_26_plen_234_part_00